MTTEYTSADGASRFLLGKLLDEFDINSQRVNREYLQHQLQRLALNASTYREQSQNPDVAPSHRARARDLEQNAYGLINGIKFALSFLDNKLFDLDGQLRQTLQGKDVAASPRDAGTVGTIINRKDN